MHPKIKIEAGAFIALSCYLLLMPFQWVISALTAMTVHELGHCAAIWACDGRVYQIRIGAFGAKIETEPMDDRQTLLCALAGPGAGALLILFYRWTPAIAVCALVQTVFNLLPIGPFDGGRAVKAIAKMTVAKKRDSVYNESN